jgi:hypothetical protein
LKDIVVCEPNKGCVESVESPDLVYRLISHDLNVLKILARGKYCFNRRPGKKSSQSRVAKMEAADTSVTIDLMFRSLFALGITKKKVVGMLT